MNAIEQARQAYAPTQVSIKTERSVEAQLFSQVTARLRAAMTSKADGFSRIASAVHENRRMWATMAADVASEHNGLPRELRAQLFYLAEFTNLHSARVLRKEADLDTLIEINTAVLRGLNGRGAI
ncbi:flagellar biosynthesis regulator FlaF [Loktanella sp. S4079]|uniref:flagellar biosynthesis regulator FlaF n=1 Tax=Loktanella sp. S4079 TaxID=579483 RepID=UPI0005F9F304|nr:flagellar biosynthesis regulator FlaF [Loktanella sp. S4079]KJZ21263.1 flagellar biosynthesis regulator FlhF [Loktanella sp. S4079]